MEASTLLRETAAPYPRASERSGSMRAFGGVLGFLRRRLSFLIIVAAPSTLAALYLFAAAADQYESAADFTVKSASQQNGGSSSGLSQLFGLSGLTSPSQSDAYSVSDYLSSHDAVAALQRRLNLTAMFRRPGVDPLTGLWSAHPAAEQLLEYYRRQVKVSYSPETGITTLKVHAFRPDDARAIAETLLEVDR